MREPTAEKAKEKIPTTMIDEAYDDHEITSMWMCTGLGREDSLGMGSGQCFFAGEGSPSCELAHCPLLKDVTSPIDLKPQ